MASSANRTTVLPLCITALSAVLSVGTGALMLADHLPFRVDANRLKNSVGPLTGNARGWREIDILVAGCGCSRRVADHLLQRGPLQGWQEQVILVGADEVLVNRFRQAQWFITTVDEGDQRLSGVHGAPSLVLVDPRGEIAYVGGYTATRRPDAAYQDSDIRSDLLAGKPREAFPIFGCAISGQLQRKLDPLGLKYGWWRNKG